MPKFIHLTLDINVIEGEDNAEILIDMESIETVEGSLMCPTTSTVTLKNGKQFSVSESVRAIEDQIKFVQNDKKIL